MSQTMIRELTDREKHIAAAAYLQGLARGLAIDRPKAWHRKTKHSELETTRVFGTVAEIMRDGCASNPLLIYEMRSLAERCGLFATHQEAYRQIGECLQPCEARP